MKKVIVILVAGLLLIRLAACVSKPKEPDSTTNPTTVTTAAEITEAKKSSDAGPYEAFLKSGQWALLQDGAWDLLERDFELTAYKVFDFDGDGVDELWLEASKSDGFDKHSGFYTIENAQIKELLSGYLSSGSSGGDYVAMYYDAQTQQHLAGLVGNTNGFDRFAIYGTYYEYKNGQLREVLDLTLTSGYEEIDSETVYTVNGKQTTEEEHNQAYARLTKPTDKKFLLEDTP